MEDNKKKIKKTSEEIRNEIKELAKKADEQSFSQLSILPKESESDAILDFGKLNLNIADPEKSYRLYYTVEGLLKKHLPKGPDNKALRDFVREEKNIFLNFGKKKDSRGLRHGDSRQTYIDPFLEESLQVVINWVRTGSHPLDLFDAFRAANIKYGFQQSASEEHQSEASDF
jgi:hypothetical protein